MKTIMEIRKDLKEIKYYYSRLKNFEYSSNKANTNNKIAETINEYNDAIKYATPKLYDIYVSLYIKNHTQESLSNELGYTKSYIYKLNKSLLNFFVERFSNSKQVMV